MLKRLSHVALAAFVALASFAVTSAPTPAHAQVIVNGRDASTGTKRVIDLGPGGVLRTTTTADVFTSVARTVTANSADQANYSAKGVELVLDVTAASGTTPTLDVKIQMKDTLSGKYVDMPGAAFAQKTAAGTTLLIVYPGIVETANVAKSSPMPDVWRAVATIGGTTPSFTFTLGAHYIN